MLRRCLVTLLVAAVLLFAFTAVACAKTKDIELPMRVGDTIILSYDGYAIFSCPATDVKDKKSYDQSKDIRAFLNKIGESTTSDKVEDDIGVAAIYNLHDFNERQITPPGGDPDYISAYLYSDVDRQPSKVYIDGDASTTWRGVNPVNADTVKLDVQWTVNGSSVSVSIPPGFDGAGDTLAWSGEVDDTWRLALDYADLTWTGYGWTSAQQWSTGSHRFGSQFYLVQAYDKVTF
ncbi:MAG: hypothetical protein QME76_08885 [Bacillota bacterium]|nr:hypothetical protein [Bacillota bacterium]